MNNFDSPMHRFVRHVCVLLLFAVSTQVHAQTSREAAGTSSPGCRIDEVVVPDITKTIDGLTTCDASDYARACDRAVTAQDEFCKAQCELYTKRAPPQFQGVKCAPYPLRTKTSAFDESKHCEEVVQGESTSYTVSCTVSATCTCDP